jgi:hypothetical protein
MGWVDPNATWMMAPAGAAGVARASAAPNAKDKPIVHAMTLVESNWPGSRRSVYEKPTIFNALKSYFP